MATAVIIMNAQNDFVNAYPEGKAIAENIADYIYKLAEPHTVVFNVQDTHYDHPAQHTWPYPLIGHYGHDMNPQVACALYETRLIYNDICYNMKTDTCAYETVGQMMSGNKALFDEVIIMGFRREDLLETAKLIKTEFPEDTKIKFATRGITYDLSVEYLMDNGWDLII